MNLSRLAEQSQSKPYRWLLLLVAGLTVVAIVTMSIAMRYLEERLLDTAGESLALASAEIADKLDRLLFERYGDARMLAHVFSARPGDHKFYTDYMLWMKDAYRPMYLRLSVTTSRDKLWRRPIRDWWGRDEGRTTGSRRRGTWGGCTWERWSQVRVSKVRRF